MKQSTLKLFSTGYSFTLNMVLWSITTIIYICSTFTISAVPTIPDSELAWKNIEVDHKKTAVFNIFRDSRGLMWIGSNHGLFFYDGVETHIVGPEVIGGTHVHSIVESNEKLYLGTNNGLFSLDFKTGIVKMETPVTDKEIRTLLLINDLLWIGGLNGITTYNLVSGEVENLTEGLPHKSVYALLRDSRGIIYAGTYSGPARWDNTKEHFYPLNVKVNNSTHSPFLANCLLESPDYESIYVGGEGVLLRYHISSDSWDKVKDIESYNIKSLAKGDNGHIMIGSDDGVYVYYPDGKIKHYRHNSQQEYSLADNEIWCVYCDSLHNVWAGHERGFSLASNSGVIRTVKLDALTHSYDGNDIYAIYRDRGSNLWLAGSNGIIRLDNRNNPKWYTHSDRPNSISHKRIRAMYEMPDGEMWFATDGGINRYDKTKDGFDVYHFTDSAGKYNSNWVYAIGCSDQFFWSGGFLSGIHFIDKAKLHSGGGKLLSDITLNNSVRRFGATYLSNDMVNNVISDKDNNMWILLFRDKYVNIYNPLADKLSKIDIHKLTGEYPSLLTIDHTGRVWCGYNGGVVMFDAKHKPRVITFPHTLDNDAPMAMGAVGDDMWVSTLNTLWKIDGESLTAQILPAPQKVYTSIYDDRKSGNVILGGTDEILVINRENFAARPDFQAIRLALAVHPGTPLSLSGIEKATEGVSIPYGGSVSLMVSTLDYSPDAVQRYMYKLTDSPADTVGQWTVLPEGVNNITLTDLKMGTYQLLVKTVGSPAKAMAIPLHVQSPFWLSWRAIILYTLLVAALVLGVIFYMRKRNKRALIEKERRTVLENAEKKLAFLSNISHDFKTPLSMIIGPVSLMKEQAKDPEEKKGLETVYDNAMRLNNMIHRSLELQHIEDANEDLLILSTFDVVDFCNGIFETFKENHPQKNFLFHSSSPSILIEADAVKFESIITNLLSNACKYSDASATISLGIAIADNNVEIIVSDDGVGIADNDQSLVFQRMFRAPDTAKLIEGTGLGLYLIKKYLELMEGNIELYSQKGQGTSFIVSLPISKKILPEQNNNLNEEDCVKPKILIVEDNLQISQFINSLLSKDYACVNAENGRSGLAIAASFTPDLIIADEMMPIMNGLEMVRRLKQNPRLASIPIIMLTAKSDNKTENDSIKLGIEIFMTKPFEPASLLGRVQQLLKAQSAIKEKMRIQAITTSQNKPIEAESVNEKTLAKIAKIIEDNISDPNLNVNLLCEKSGIPNKQLYRLIKKYMDMTPVDYIRGVRLQKAAVLLSQHRFTVAEISYMVGFNTPSYFAKCFQNQFGVKPSHYHSDDESTAQG